PLLIEVDIGRAEGLTWEELSQREPALAERLVSTATNDWPGGETATQVAARAVIAADRLGSLRRAHPVVVVSHGMFLHALATALGADDDLGDVLDPCGVRELA